MSVRDDSKYTAETLSVWSIISAHFVDFTYNELYVKAVEEYESGRDGTSSLTDSYRKIILSYARAIDQPVFYTRIVQRMHEYYQNVTSYKSSIFGDFQDMILRQFIPLEFYSSFTRSDKDKYFLNIIKRTINDISRIILDDTRRVIDTRADGKYEAAIEYIQQRSIDSLAETRETFYDSFAQQLTNNRESVPRGEVEAMRKRHRIESKKLNDLTAVMKNDIETLSMQVDQLTSENARLSGAIGEIEPQFARIVDEKARLTRIVESLDAKVRDFERKSEQSRVDFERKQREFENKQREFEYKQREVEQIQREKREIEQQLHAMRVKCEQLERSERSAHSAYAAASRQQVQPHQAQPQQVQPQQVQTPSESIEDASTEDANVADPTDDFWGTNVDYDNADTVDVVDTSVNTPPSRRNAFGQPLISSKYTHTDDSDSD